MPIARNGFKLVGHLNGTVVTNIKRYQANKSGINNARIFVGDPVALGSAGTVSPMWFGSVQTPEGSQYFGVATGIYENERGRPLTFRTNKFATSANDYWIDVCIDPDAIYEAAYNASANQTVLGSLAYLAYASANTAAGISGAGLKPTPAASATEAAFRVIDIKNLNFDAQTNDQNGRVHVIANNHLFRSTTDL